MTPDLSEADLKLILDIIHSSLTCQNIDEFEQLLAQAKKLVNFSHLQCECGDWSEFEDNLSLAGEHFSRDKRSQQILTYLGPHLGQAVKRIIPGKQKPPAHLTPREREVLSWTASGKTAWEISQILNISNRTVEFHMGNILNKFDAVNSQQAVAIAVSSGLIVY